MRRRCRRNGQTGSLVLFITDGTKRRFAGGNPPDSAAPDPCLTLIVHVVFVGSSSIEPDGTVRVAAAA